MDERQEFIMSHFGVWLKITPETQEAARLMNEAAEKLLQMMDEVKQLLEIKDEAA